MTRTFTLRVDLESDKGIKAVPKFLNLLKKYKIKASFYVPMGGESNLFDLLKYRKNMESAGERKIKVWSFKEKLRIALLPKDFVKKNKRILKQILFEGHELGLHGWKHREWTRGLDKINIKKKILQSKLKYIKLFGKEPISFASPGFNVNDKVLRILERNNIQFISDFQGKKVKKYGELKNVPITICGKNKMPIIEYLVGERKNDEEILEYIKKSIKRNELSSMYVHGLFEIRFKLNLLEKLFIFLKNKKIKSKRVIDY